MATKAMPTEIRKHAECWNRRGLYQGEDRAMPVTPEKTIEILVTCVENCGLAGYDELAGRLRASIAAALRAAEARGAARERCWVPVTERLPTEKFILLSGKNDDGSAWRDVGVHLGSGDFRDKYSADSHPTHWMPLPEPPEDTTNA